MNMIQTMRWYGPNDTVQLSYLRQAGCSGVVTALHQIPVGEVWPVDLIMERKNLIEAAGMKWLVVESLPVHEDIKKHHGNYLQLIENYKQSLINLAACGIKVVTYNFMPVLDWIRTDLKYTTHTGALALRFDKVAFIAFDLFLLERPGAARDYAQREVDQAHDYFQQLSEMQKQELMFNCLQGLPGSQEHFSLTQVLDLLNGYKGISAALLQQHLIDFLRAITPTADELDLQLAIHPDDPPYPILGLPRVMSTEADAVRILTAVPAPSNGLCFCSGSFGARADNYLPGMIRRLGHRIHFLHLRSTKRDDAGNFYEANHLEGDADMYRLVKEIILLQQKEGRSIPMRPDHGHQMLDDLHKDAFPGYSIIGRLKALAELRGLELGILRMLNEEKHTVN